jgi:hypothetical protein
VRWARDAVAASRKIVLIEDRMEALTAQVRHLADGSRTSIAGWRGWRPSSI